MNLSVMLPDRKATVKTVLGAMSLLLVILVSANHGWSQTPQWDTGLLFNASGILPKNEKVYVQAGKPLEFNIRVSSRHTGNLSRITFEPTGNPRVKGRREKTCPPLLGFIPIHLPCQELEHKVTFTWRDSGVETVKLAVYIDGQPHTLQDHLEWTVIVVPRAHAEITKRYPNGLEGGPFVKIGVNQKQKFEIEATSHKTIDFIKFWAEGQEASWRDTGRCFVFCETHDHSRTYSWNRAGVYFVDARVLPKKSLTPLDTFWVVKVGN